MCVNGFELGNRKEVGRRYEMRPWPKDGKSSTIRSEAGRGHGPATGWGRGLMRQVIRVGLVGAGFIGRAHGLAIHAVNTVFRDRPYDAVAHVLAESTAERAQSAGEELRFASHSDDWREAVSDCDALVIAVPSHLHLEIARHALESGVPILCEKPVGLSSVEAHRIAELARETGLAQAVGFTYARAPLVRHAQALVESGEIGRPLTFHGRHCEDYLADPKAPFSWRLDASLAGRCGALAISAITSLPSPGCCAVG